MQNLQLKPEFECGIGEMPFFDTAIVEDSWVILDGLIDQPIHLKLEGGHPSGSIKIKTACGLFKDAVAKGLISPDATIVESSSGNLGVALAMICANNGIKFRCFVDPNISPTNAAIMRALGAQLAFVTEKDENGGYLGTRIRELNAFLEENPNAVWLNQYSNSAGPNAHYELTAPAIAKKFPGKKRLYVGAGTTGTLMGCAKYFLEHETESNLVAVDSDGSVTFGTAPMPRHIPGLGTSVVPEIFDGNLVPNVVHVPEIDTIKMCRKIAREYGILLGGSTGTVLAGIVAYHKINPSNDTVCAISPDFGEKYVSTIYDDEWVETKFGKSALAGEMNV